MLRVASAHRAMNVITVDVDAEEIVEGTPRAWLRRSALGCDPTTVVADRWDPAVRTGAMLRPAADIPALGRRGVTDVPGAAELVGEKTAGEAATRRATG